MTELLSNFGCESGKDLRSVLQTDVQFLVQKTEHVVCVNMHSFCKNVNEYRSTGWVAVLGSVKLYLPFGDDFFNETS